MRKQHEGTLSVAQIAKTVGMSDSFLRPILSRAGFDRFRKGVFYFDDVPAFINKLDEEMFSRAMYWSWEQRRTKNKLSLIRYLSKKNKEWASMLNGCPKKRGITLCEDEEIED